MTGYRNLRRTLRLSHCHLRVTPQRLQLDPVARPRPGGKGAATGVLMWTTLFGIAFVISFSLVFAAIAMDF